MPSSVPEFTARTLAEWRCWLRENHATASGVWLIAFKKESGMPYLPYDAQVEEALRWGWVDSRPNAVDELRSKRLFSPRKPGGAWSAKNKATVERLLRAGKMEPSGIAAIEAAKRSGAWVSYDDVEALAIPADLEKALAKNAKARRYFDAFPPSSKKIILWWIASAKRDETRASRVSETVRLAAQNIRANHYRQPKTATAER